MSAGAGNTQIINGHEYVLYSPEWYAARNADKIAQASTAGTAAKTYQEAAMPDSLKALLGSLSSGISGGSAAGATGGFTAGGGSVGSTGGSSTNGTGVMGSSSPTIPTIAPPDATAATNAEYATAKDRVGKAGRASIDALRGELGATGMLGGGAEGQLVANQVNNAFGELGQVSRDQASKSADQAADFAKTGYAGAITQRGQDVAAREAEARLATERQLQESQQSFQQAQLKSQQQLQLLSMALGGLKSLSGGLY